MRHVGQELALYPVGLVEGHVGLGQFVEFQVQRAVGGLEFLLLFLYGSQHIVETLTQSLHLVAALDLAPDVQVSLGGPVGHRAEMVHRTENQSLGDYGEDHRRHDPRKHHAHQERHPRPPHQPIRSRRSRNRHVDHAHQLPLLELALHRRRGTVATGAGGFHAHRSKAPVHRLPPVVLVADHRQILIDVTHKRPQRVTGGEVQPLVRRGQASAKFDQQRTPAGLVGPSGGLKSRHSARRGVFAGMFANELIQPHARQFRTGALGLPLGHQFHEIPRYYQGGCNDPQHRRAEQEAKLRRQGNCYELLDHRASILRQSIAAYHPDDLKLHIPNGRFGSILA